MQQFVGQPDCASQNKRHLKKKGRENREAWTNERTLGRSNGWTNGWEGKRIAQYTGIEYDDASQPRKIKHDWKIQNVKRKKNRQLQ